MKYKVKCVKCGKFFEIECAEKDFIKGKYKKCCSSECAHKRIQSEETKRKIGEALRKRQHIIKDDNILYVHKCKICGKEYANKSRTKFCSEKCKHINNFLPTLIKYFSFNKECLGTCYVFDEIDRIKNELIDLYWNKSLNGNDIAKIYNYPSCCNITGKIFKYLNIPVRSLSETNILNYLNGKLKTTVHPKYKQGWHTAWNGKEVYLHSSYEFDYANELDKNKINYDVECLRLKYFNTEKNSYCCAIPDFYLIDSNTIVEIKSTFTLNVQEMKDKFFAYKKQGYDCKLIVNHQEVNLEDL